MPDDGARQDAIWPLPKFYFSVEIDGIATISFQEVSGLNSETQVIEYRHGNSPSFYPIKMPGLGKVGNVTLRKGIFAGDNTLWHWYSEIAMNTIRRRNVAIKLLDETAKPTMVWLLHNAWPTKLTSTDLKSDGNEVAIETLELAYETLTISNA